MKRRLHMGCIIKQYIVEKGISVGKLATKMSCSPRNIYNLYERESINTQTLERLSMALGHNFGKYLSDHIETRLDNNSVK
jgi:plasmid maintenance system antidote protein VapI